MSARRILFLDRDGTLNEEVADEQIDSLAKIRLMPGVIPALLELQRAGFAFVMVSNQDGLGTPSFPRESFDIAQRFILDLFSSQGIAFEAVFLCPHFKREDCACRKPKLGMIQAFLPANDIDKAHSFMIGDRETDLEFARQLGRSGRAHRLGRPRRGNLAGDRRAHPRPRSPRTPASQDPRNRRQRRSGFVARGPERDRQRLGVFRSYARTDRKTRRLCLESAMQRGFADR